MLLGTFGDPPGTDARRCILFPAHGRHHSSVGGCLPALSLEADLEGQGLLFVCPGLTVGLGLGLWGWIWGGSSLAWAQATPPPDPPLLSL